MAHEYSISELGLDLIKAYEGFRPVEMVLVSGQKVIGYGHPYVRGEASLLTQRRAEDLLKADLEPIEKIINQMVFAPLSQNQFDALVSLAFNIGIDDFADSTVLHYLNNGQPLAAAAGFDEWRKSIIADQTYVVDALVRRRTAEKALFLGPASGLVTAPRYEIPVIHDSTVRNAEDDIEVFSQSDEDGFVEQAPYEEQPAQENLNEDNSSSALMLSERATVPVIYDEAPEANIVSDEILENDNIQDAVIDNVVEIQTEVAQEIADEVQIETETEAETEAEIGHETDTVVETAATYEENAEVEFKPEVYTEAEVEEEEVEAGPAEDEDLSPIALAAADVSERLDNLMEEEVEVNVEELAEEISVDEVANVVASADDEIAEETAVIDEAELMEFEAAEPGHAEPRQAEPEYAEPEHVELEAEEANVVESNVREVETLENEVSELETSEFEDHANDLEKPAPEAIPGKKKSGGAYGTALIVGLLLIGGALWKLKFAPSIQLGKFGEASEFLAPVVLLVGAMMILGGMYYMLKAQLRKAS